MRVANSWYSDVVLALFVIAIAVMLVIPLPTIALDFLLALNISFALLLLLVGLYVPNALALLAFPALLLLTTLFRLGLNVASTRLILSEGDAGRVIEAFGTFLLRGEVVVGVIIFVIITIVNFIVIARGASRVSEVAARFALDALPGKQMAIDSDMRAGIITAHEAQEKRETLRKESQLYGAMDGAMKFVQGDAIAGLFITLTNILGGLYIGVANGMDFSDAIQTYVVLTVGDGLVTQIPALLISICAGIVVTRVSSGENTTLGAELGSQLFQRPSLLILSALIVLLLTAVSGLPWLPFLVVGLIFVTSAVVLLRLRRGEASLLPAHLDPIVPQLGYVGGGESEDASYDEVPLLVRLDASVLYPVYQQNAVTYTAWWLEFQKDYLEEVGLKLPPLKVVPNEFSSSGEYSILRGNTFIESGSLLLDGVLVEVNPFAAGSFGLEVLKEEPHPVTGEKVFWAARNAALKRVTDAASIRTFDFLEFVALKAAVFFRHFPEELLGISEVHVLLKYMEKQYPGLLEDALNTDFFTVSRFTEVLQELVRERVNVRDFKQLIESLAAYQSSYGQRMVEDGDFDLQDIVTFVRVNRKRHTLAPHLSVRGTLKVFTLSDALEEALDDAPATPGHKHLGLDPEIFERMSDGLSAVLSPLQRRGLLPVSILCRGDQRSKIQSFLRSIEMDLGVATFEELHPQIRVEPAGLWSI